MQFGLLFSISKTHLLTRKKQSIIAALGVTFGIGTYIIMMSFMNGLNGLLDGLILNRTPHIHLYNEIEPSEKQPVDLYSGYKEKTRFVVSVKPRISQLRIHNALPMLDYLSRLPYVRGVNPQVKSQAFYMGGTIRLNGTLTGIDVKKEKELYNLDQYIIEGKIENLLRNQNGILLGAGVAQKLSLNVGDVVQVTTVSGAIRQLKIVGLFQSGMADIDNVQSYVNLKTAQQFMNQSSNYITDINVKLYDMEKAPELAKKLASLFHVTAKDIQTANAQFDTGSSIRLLISYAVSITLLIVAGFGIYNILNMMIYEKMNDIAILKATGFSGQDVMTIFIFQAIIIGVLGGLMGLLLGYSVSVIIDNTPFETAALPTVKTYPIEYNPKYYLIGICFAMISTFMAGYLPSRKAKKIDPVDIIRGQ